MAVDFYILFPSVSFKFSIMDHFRPLQQPIIEVKTSDGFKVLRLSNILYLEAAGKCTIVYLVDFKSIITYHMLKWYDIRLCNYDFFRCHISFIVNCRLIDCYNSKEVSLKGKKKISIARKRVSLFKERLKYLYQDPF